MSDIRERLNELKSYYKLSGSALAKRADVNTTSVNCFLSGKSSPSYDFLSKLLDAFPSVSAEWLLRGKGNMLIEAKSEVESQIAKELADAKTKLLVQEGITKELRDMLLEKSGSLPVTRSCLVG